MSPRKALDYYLMKANRVIVWALLFLMILLAITGYGLTKPNLITSLTSGLIDYQTALHLHTLLDVPLLVFLVVHVAIEIKFSLMRWGFKSQKLLNLLVLLLAAFSLILIVYVEFASP